MLYLLMMFHLLTVTAQKSGLVSNSQHFMGSLLVLKGGIGMRTKYEMFRVMDSPIQDRTAVAYTYPKDYQYIVSWFSNLAVTFSPTIFHSLYESMERTIRVTPPKSLRQVLNRERWNSLYVTGRKV